MATDLQVAARGIGLLAGRVIEETYLLRQAAAGKVGGADGEQFAVAVKGERSGL